MGANVYTVYKTISILTDMKVIVKATLFFESSQLTNIYVLRNCYVLWSEQDKVPALKEPIY